MKTWKSMVKRTKEVLPHLVEEIMEARKCLVGLLMLGELCESETLKVGMADERTGPSAIDLDLGVPTD
jgi:hypothetical protein